MTKRQYVNALMQQPIEWIRDSMNNPSPHMKPIHILLHRVAIRRFSKLAR